MLLSCLGKLFTKILHERLLKYSIQKNILAKEQTDFLRGNRASDNPFILHSLGRLISLTSFKFNVNVLEIIGLIVQCDSSSNVDHYSCSIFTVIH